MLVLGEAAPFEVEGVWLMRGTEVEDVKAMLECNPTLSSNRVVRYPLPSTPSPPPFRPAA